jgi:hypothetical protein
MKKYRVTQIYTSQDIWYEVEAESKEEAILKISELPSDEGHHYDTETEVKELNCTGDGVIRISPVQTKERKL